MKKIIKELAANFLASFEKSLRFNAPKVTVLLFHSVSSNTL